MSQADEQLIQDWVEALKKSFLRIPSAIAIAGTAVSALNLIVVRNSGMSIGPLRFHLFDAFCIFACFLVATLPVWYYSTDRLIRHGNAPSFGKQIAACLTLLALAALVAPRFEISYRDYDSRSATLRRDNTLTLIKRSLVETVRMPHLELDELTWLQSSFSAQYIPAEVYCPLRSTRLYPFLGAVYESDYANALAGNGKPPAPVLENAIAQCKRDGPAMRAAGYTKEAALLEQDIDRFFTLNRLANVAGTSIAPSNSTIVLPDEEIPAQIIAKVEAVLAESPDFRLDYLEDPNFETNDGQVRRLKALVLAEAFGRSSDIAHLKADR